MAVGELSSRRIIEVIPIHFDVSSHHLPLEIFVRTAQETEGVIRSFNHALFEGKLKYELLVLPPEEGTFLSRIGLALLAGWGVVWTFTESDIGKAFITGLTTHEPAYWAEIAGKTVRQTFVADAEGAAVVSGNESAEEGELIEEATRCKYKSSILAETAKSFLQADASALESVGVTPQMFRNAFLARNGFYEACTATPQLRAVGFEETPHFPIDRSDFAHLQVALPPEAEEPEVPWVTGIVVLKVTSPNWDRDDRHRAWKVKDGHGRERYFRIEDEHFWTLVKAERLSIHIIDTIKVQWAFRGTTDNPRDARVLKVLEFNGEHLSDPLDENALGAILGIYNLVDNQQGELFGL